MSRAWLAACVALCACVASMVRAPNQIPRDGVVKCTDSMDAPLEALAVGAASLGASFYAARQSEAGTDWILVLGTFGATALLAGMEGSLNVFECRDAKLRGAAIAEAARRKAEARAEAGMQWKRAAAAARADDCATVRALDPQVRALDVEVHDVVFLRDIAISRCLFGALER